MLELQQPILTRSEDKFSFPSFRAGSSVAAGLPFTEGRETGKYGKVECAPQLDPIDN